MTLTLTGDLLGARRHLTRALKIDSFGLPGEASHLFLAVNGRISSATYLHDCLLLLGEVDQADAMAKKAEAMALEVQNSASRQPYSQALAQNHLLRMHVFRGETDKATALSSTLLKLSDEHKYLYFSGTSVIYMGWALAQQGNLREAILLWHRGVKQLRAIGALCWLPRYFVLLAEYYSQIGNPDPGLEAISQAHETIGRTGERGWHAEVFRLEGQLLLHKSRRTRLAQRCFERAIKTAQAQRARLFELRAATCLAELLLQTGQTAEGYNALASVCAQFSSRHTNADVRRAHALLKSATLER
jgi:tetratricopeptide (TPR) repeat protein